MYNNNYNNDFNSQNRPVYGNPGEKRGFAIASCVLGILSIPAAMTSYPAIILGVLGLIFGIFSKGNAEKRSSAAIAGIVTGSIGIVFGFAVTIFTVYIFLNNPDYMEQFSELMNFYNRK